MAGKKLTAIGVGKDPFKGMREYFCRGCGELRLDTTGKKTSCGGCGHNEIIFGKIGELNVKALRENT